MKLLTMSLALIGGWLPLHGKDPEWTVEIPGDISDGTPSPPAPKPAPLDFQVQVSRTTRVQVTESVGVPQVPDAVGIVNVTVQKVVDPRLPESPPPLPALPPDDPAVLARMKELAENHHDATMVFLSATVYDHSRTLLKIYQTGGGGGEISAWSNLNFNHFSGFGAYRVKQADGSFREYGLLMGIGNVHPTDSDESSTEPGQEDDSVEIPALPDLAARGPAFLLSGGEEEGTAADILAQLHDLYRKEGQRMRDAYNARFQAEEERKAELLLNPPVPKDISIQFWKREAPSSTLQPQHDPSSR